MGVDRIVPLSIKTKGNKYCFQRRLNFFYLKKNRKWPLFQNLIH
jgi:hypothetical protein